MSATGYVPSRGVDGEEYGATAGAGWVTFAAVPLGIAGVFNVFDGILAVSKSTFFMQDATYVFGDLNTWGWIVMALGTIELLAAFAIVSGSSWAQWFGVGAASLNAIGQLMFLPAYPWWALAMFSVDLLIIFALVVYGGARLRETA